MGIRAFAVFVIVFSLATTELVAQHSSSTTEGPLETSNDVLRRHHIAHTEPALIAALQNNDPEVRELAAVVLAEDGAKDAIPSIVEALRAETVPENQASMALSLARLGESMGRETLKNMCDDATKPDRLRMAAAVKMRYLHDDSCLPAVGLVLQSGRDAAARTQALYLVPSFRHLPEEDFQPLFGLVVKALEDREHGVRMAASSVLGQIGDVSAIPHLRNALAKEQNDGCRLTMRLVLQQLEKKGH
ncbi:MAG: HEAT repeat domain-containing protein [Terriglobales bacterium]|jgi:HEAT repeat protein